MAKSGIIKQTESVHERAFATLWKMLGTKGVEPVREFRFSSGRRWRFDFAFPEYLVAVELEGGHWSANSRHTRGSGFSADCEKYSEAAADGWLVLRFTGDDLKKRPSWVVDLVKRAMRFCEPPTCEQPNE